MSRILRTAASLLLAIVLLSLPCATRAQAAVRFGAISASGHFPDEIIFSVAAESDTDIVKLELSYRIVGSPYTQSRWPEFAAAQRVETSYRLDTQVDFYPPGTEFHYYWTATDAAGNVTDSPEQAFTYDDDRFTWQELGTDRVAVYWYDGGQAFGQELLDTATRALERLEKDTGAHTQRKIRIYIYGNDSDLRGALGPNARDWIGGQTIQPLALIVALISPTGPSSEIGRIIPHELSHVVLYQATHNPYAGTPYWLEEGVAMHNQEVPDYEFPLLVEEAALEGRLIPLRALSASFPTDPDLAYLSYAESSSIIEFVLSTYGPEGLSALIKAFAQGETAAGGVQQALGISLDELDGQWRATLPAAEVTPVPGTTPPPFSAPGTPSRERGGADPLLIAFASASAVTFVLAIGVVVAVIVMMARRRRALPAGPQAEQQPPPPPAPPDGA